MRFEPRRLSALYDWDSVVRWPTRPAASTDARLMSWGQPQAPRDSARAFLAAHATELLGDITSRHERDHTSPPTHSVTQQGLFLRG